MMIDNLLNVSIHFAVPAFFFWWWVGSVFVLDPEARKSKTISLASTRNRLAVVAAAVVLVCFMGRSVFLWAGEINFFEGFKRSKSGVDLAGAARYLERAYSYHHLEVNNDYELANVYARMQRGDDALRMYQIAMDANSGYDELFFNRGTLYMQSGNIPAAIQDYQRALRINPTSHEAYNALSALYLKDIKLYGQDAEALFKRAIALAPNDKDTWNNYGYLLTQMQRDAEAFNAYQRAVEIDPDFEVARKNLVIIGARLPNHPTTSLQTLEEEYARLDRLIGAKQWDAASELVSGVLKKTPQSFRAHFYAGNINFSRDRIPEAIDEYRETVRLRPGLIAGWQNLGIALARVGRNAEARAAFQQVLSLDPKNTLAPKMLSQLQ